MFWDELSKIALLGTDRTVIPPSLKQKLETLGVNPEMEAAELILKGAAILQARKKAGVILEKWTKAIPSMSDDVEENYCSATSTQHLEQIIGGAHASAFDEFIDLMNAYQKTLSPVFIPTILERAVADKGLRKWVLPLVGERGRWLIQQNPEWTLLFSKLSIDQWVEGNTEVRLNIFEKTRVEQPQVALKLLETSWPEMDTKVKIAFLQKMQSNLNPSDEPFLEDRLYETRKEIRQAASNLLSQLPNSALVERMWERLQLYVNLTKGQQKPTITLPENIDETMLRDGIDPRHQWKSGGLKASRLGQMVAIIPPTGWEKATHESPEAIIQLFSKSDWSTLFMQAFSHAAILHQNEEWKTIILSHWIKNFESPKWQDLPTNKLLDSLSPTSFDQLCLLALKTNPDFSNEHAPLLIIIRSSKHLWTAALSKTLIRSFQKWMAQQANSHWGAWHYRAVLKMAAYHCAISVYPDLRKNWPTDAPVWSAWQRDIEIFLSTLQFRKEMNQHLSTPNKNKE